MPTPLTNYFPVLPYQAPAQAMPSLIPVLSSMPLAGDHKNITRIIVALHDYTRDPRPLFDTIVRLAGAQNAHTLVVAPQFLIEPDIAHIADQLPDDGKNVASWTISGWSEGDPSIAGPLRLPVSSFNVIDLLLLFFSDLNYFPDLRQIVIIGHGDGARFAQLYAAAGRAPAALKRQNIDVSYVVANAPSFLYFTPVRIGGQQKGFGKPETNVCPNFDAWPYGLNDLNPYVRQVGMNTIKLDYTTQSVAYLNGASLAKNDALPDASCAANVQGKNRVERFQNYQTYLENIMGADVHHAHNFTIIPKTGYDMLAVLGSACGMAMMFGDGHCFDTSPQ